MYSFGAELELSDVDKRIPIPPELGEWEWAETDIVNSDGRAVDPLGLEPPFGGEINMVPTWGLEGQVEIFEKIMKLFKDAGTPATAQCINHLHIHVFVPGLREDVEQLKKLSRYVKDNQEDFTVMCNGITEDDEFRSVNMFLKNYIRFDGCRRMPSWMCDNLQQATDFNDYIRIQCCGKDGVSRGRPFRYGINTYCLKHNNTVEFRIFRPTVDPELFRNCLLVCQDFLDAALGDQRPIKEIILEKGYTFPQLNFSKKLAEGWYETKYDKSRGTKERKFLTPVNTKG